MASTRAGIVILLWTIVFITSVIVSPLYPIAGAFAAGSLVTAAAMVLTVKWSVEEMLSDTFSGVEEMQKQLSENHNPVTDQLQDE